jgi:Domain of unknown function (DUF4157)
MHAFAEKPKASMPTVFPAIRTSSDGHEHEADHAAEHVMRMPASPLQRADQKNGRLPTEAPAIVHDVVRTPGRPLDPQTRRFMEPRFGHDFSQVRVHTDANSAESAKAVEALAYTFGRHVVFGPGRYVPATGEGRWLLAHELAHVVQQADAPALQRKPDGDAEAKARREKQLEELARDPAEAHKAWKKLTPAERDAVTERMRRRYGEVFAQEFLGEVKKGKPQFDVVYYQPGVGPTREQLFARGYRRAGSEQTGNAGFEVEIWVHPVGKTVRRDVATWKFGTSGPGTKAGSEAGKQPAKKPPVVEPPTEPPVTTARHEQALDFLEDMKTWNTALHSLCKADPFNLSEAENAEIEWNFAREAVRDFKDLDWTGVYPDFWKDVSELAEENLELRAACCKRDPTSYWFDCGTLPKAP